MPLNEQWVHDVYACAAGDLPWEASLRPIVHEMRGTCLGVVKHSIAPVRADVLVRLDVDETAERAYVERYVHQNPVINCLSAMPLGYVTAGSGAVDEKFYLSSSFYNDWQKPSGYADNLGVSLARRQGQFVLLSLPRSFDVGTYSRDELATIYPYVPHLVRAFNIWLRLTATEAESGWVSEAMDQMAQGLIILGEDRVILYANKGGEKLLAANGPLQRVNFRLRVQGDEIADRLDHLIRQFESGEAEDTEEYGLSIPRGHGKSPLFLRVQPPLGLRPGQRNLGLPKAVAFLHVVDPDERCIADLKTFSEGYRLTAAEERFVEALARLESIVEAARAVGVSEATARTHMQHIYGKTGSDSFAGLLGKIYRSALR